MDASEAVSDCVWDLEFVRGLDAEVVVEDDLLAVAEIVLDGLPVFDDDSATVEDGVCV